jgi:hypothetical protein
MRFLGFLVILALIGVGLWHFGVLQDVGGTFDGWMRFIGAR